VTPGSERGVAGRASKGLDPLNMAMLAISEQSVDVSIGNPVAGALSVGTGVALGVHADGALPVGFSPRARVAQVEVTGGAIEWGAGA
jgi:hypothetical protein